MEAKPFNHGLLYCHISESLAVMRVLEDIVSDIKKQTNQGQIKVIDPLPLLERVTATYEQLVSNAELAMNELEKKQ